MSPAKLHGNVLVAGACTVGEHAQLKASQRQQPEGKHQDRHHRLDHRDAGLCLAQAAAVQAVAVQAVHQGAHWEAPLTSLARPLSATHTMTSLVESLRPAG
jgi:hypothetical protein